MHDYWWIFNTKHKNLNLFQSKADSVFFFFYNLGIESIEILVGLIGKLFFFFPSLSDVG